MSEELFYFFFWKWHSLDLKFEIKYKTTDLSSTRLWDFTEESYYWQGKNNMIQFHLENVTIKCDRFLPTLQLPVWFYYYVFYHLVWIVTIKKLRGEEHKWKTGLFVFHAGEFLQLFLLPFYSVFNWGYHDQKSFSNCSTFTVCHMLYCWLHTSVTHQSVMHLTSISPPWHRLINHMWQL